MIRPVQFDERLDALRLAFQEFETVEREARVVAALTQYETNPHLFDGLLVDVSGDQVEGLIWIVEMPGKTCVTGLPCVRNPDNLERILQLLQAANQWLETSGCSLNQFVLSPEQHRLWGQILHHVQHPIEILLDHLAVSTQPPRSAVQVADSLLQPIGADAVADPFGDDFIRLLSNTFLDSQDCPAITGHQSYKDMVRGYFATGDTGSRWWRVFRRDGEALGCCLLTEHRSLRQMEVVYIGMTPAARGQGLGRLALQEALQLARGLGLESLIAVVDRHNQPARRMYQSLHFTPVSTRVSRIRLLPRKSP